MKESLSLIQRLSKEFAMLQESMPDTRAGNTLANRYEAVASVLNEIIAALKQAEGIDDDEIQGAVVELGKLFTELNSGNIPDADGQLFHRLSNLFETAGAGVANLKDARAFVKVFRDAAKAVDEVRNSLTADTRAVDETSIEKYAEAMQRATAVIEEYKRASSGETGMVDIKQVQAAADEMDKLQKIMGAGIETEDWTKARVELENIKRL